MKVVLSKTVAELGEVGEMREVRAGFAKNYLFPKQLAVLVDDPKAKVYRREGRATALKLLEMKSFFKELAGQWQGAKVTIKAKASADGTLYGSVGAKEILKALGRNDVDLAIESVLKKTGEHSVGAVFPDGTAIQLTVTILSTE